MRSEFLIYLIMGFTMQQNNNELKTDGGLTYHKVIIIFLFICLIGLAVITTVFNSRMEQHDRELTFEICTLISEKMDNSIRYMADSAESASALLGGSLNSDDPGSLFNSLKKNIRGKSFISMGIIDGNGNIYASPTEHAEFEKWDLVDSPRNERGVTISEPYRSAATGEMVLTIFSDVYTDGEKTASIFMTYPLDEIQDMANTDTLGDETEIWLMDGTSDNFIRCSGEESVIGSYSNFKLYKQSIEPAGSYSKWEASMRRGDRSAAVNYTIDGTDYTQVYKNIDYMPGWNVVVRMPSHSLTGTMKVILITIICFALVIIAAAFAMLFYFHRKETAEKEVFEKLSTYDPLTQIFNRRAFDSFANKLIEDNTSSSFVFMFIDIDYFKQVNDKYGHETGDRVLVDFADSIRAVFGSESITARYGGDEFVALLRDKTKEQVGNMMEQLRIRLSDIVLDENDPEAKVHFSAGISLYPDNAGSFRELVRCADNALYKVKEQGRNDYRWYKA